jgi:hypothetical protein
VVTCKHCSAEIIPCPDCPKIEILGAGYVEADSDALGGHWCKRVTDGQPHEPEVTP